VSGEAGGTPGGGDGDDSDDDASVNHRRLSHTTSTKSQIPVDTDEEPSHAISMFTKLYQNRQDRFSCDPDQSFQPYETTFILNMIA
jgi:hypothetical protein